MVYKAGLGNWIQRIDYGKVIPASSKLPLSLGEKTALLRGVFAAALDYDWRYLAVREHGVWNRTYQSMQIIDPEAGTKKWAKNTWKRFQHYAREEWQACLFRSSVMEKIKQKSHIEGLEELFKLRKQDRGMVLVSCHLDSFCMGMVLLGMHGLPVNVINTKEIENPRIHPQVRAFYQSKYSAMENLMQGRMPYYQTDMPYFYQALRRAELVTLMGDIPGSKSDIYIQFLGREFRLPLGAWHLAKKTSSLIGGFVCVHEGTGRYRVICLPPMEIDPNDPRASLVPVYEFLESWIKKMPERWVTADLLSGFCQG